MTFWSQLVSDPLPLSFWKLAQKCYASNKSFSGEYETNHREWLQEPELWAPEY